MPVFEYSAIDRAGSERTGTIEAVDAEAVRSRLSGKSLMVVSVRPKSEEEAIPANSSWVRRMRLGRGVREEQVTAFTRQFATLVEAGLPLLRALEILVRQERGKRFAGILEAVAHDVRCGNSLSRGLERHAHVFGQIYVNMVRAGETGGVLGVVLARLADFGEKAQRMRRKVRSAMSYPVVVGLVAVAIVALLMAFVVPRFQTIFDDMLQGAALPAPTQWVVSTGASIGSNFVVAIILITVATAGVICLRQTSAGVRALDWCSIHFPLTGELVRKVNTARVSRTLGTLLGGGVPVLDALAITRQTAGNVFYANALMRVHAAVRDGETVAASLMRERVFFDKVVSMVEVGEETGDLAGMLVRIADAYDEEVDDAVAGLTSVIEPAMIVFLALVVGFIVIALFLPIVEIIRQMTG